MPADRSDSPESVEPEVGLGGQPALVPAGEILPSELLVLPVAHRPVMPGITVPMSFSLELYKRWLLPVAESDSRVFGVVLATHFDPENIEKSSLHEVGSVLRIEKLVVGEEQVQLLARGMERIICRREISREPILRWEVEYIRNIPARPADELKAYTLGIINSVKELLKLSPLFQEQLKMLMSHLDFENPGLLMDLISALTTAEGIKLQDILATFDPIERGKKVLQLLREEIDLQRLQEQIKTQIEQKIGEHQKEFFLREQLKVIKKELGIEKDDKSSDLEEMERKLANLKLTEEASRVVKEEMGKLGMLESSSHEYHVVRNYLNWILDLPWGISTADHLELAQARAVLDQSHYGLDDVKDRILEFIATLRKRGRSLGSIICLVGPPGVGKTSVGKSIAEALGRKFYRFSVGGMRDEAEIKGHRRTYIGAMPGKLVQALKRTGTANPVILLDEIDKLTTSYQGDPAAALLEVLDPEQNREFLDHYLDVRFDLSQVLFLTTANSLDTIPAPLLDRMEVIKLSGYVMEEKLHIARNHLIPHQTTEHGLTKRDLRFSDAAIRFLIDGYAREAGVRSLENQIRKVCRKVARRHAEGETGILMVSPDTIEQMLGQPAFTGEDLYNRKVPGVALGLAWTSMGGATLYMECAAHRNTQGGFRTTGQLGEVMAESAQIAYSLVRRLMDQTSGDKALAFFQEHMIHLHIPAGATPKDGPSAGITMALALHSLATGKPVRGRLAMTGELTITGKVLPIGGVREKVIAARRVKVFELIFPKDNQRDFRKLPEYIREGVQAHFVDTFQDVLHIAYEGSVPVGIPNAKPTPSPKKQMTKKPSDSEQSKVSRPKPKTKPRTKPRAKR